MGNMVIIGPGKYCTWPKYLHKPWSLMGTLWCSYTLYTFLPSTAINHGGERECYNFVCRHDLFHSQSVTNGFNLRTFRPRYDSNSPDRFYLEPRILEIS